MEASNTVNKVKVRDSNMELLRLLAMFLVLVVHANFRALPRPDSLQIATNTTSALLQFMTEGFSIVAVDVFVLLSGWYGIKMKFSRLAEMGFQLLFFGLLGIGICAVYDPANLDSKVLSRLFLTDGGYWFVKSYVVLFVFAPVINAFIGSADRKTFRNVLIAFFAFELAYDWLSEGTSWLRGGYSFPSFMGLYMLARYVRLYKPAFSRFSKWADLGIYLCAVCFLTFAVCYLRYKGVKAGALYFYDCPVVMAGALYLLLFFSKLPVFKNKVINWLAISCLAVYLTQSSNFISCYYDKFILNWFETETRVTFIIYTGCFIFAVFIGSMLIDKVRLALWKPIEKLAFKKNNKKA